MSHEMIEVQYFVHDGHGEKLVVKDDPDCCGTELSRLDEAGKTELLVFLSDEQLEDIHNVLGRRLNDRRQRAAREKNKKP